MKTGIALIYSIAVLSFSFNEEYFGHDQEKNYNDPPKLVISIPGNKGNFKWNSIVRYSINVTDKEDGLSEYNEINPNEVVLEVNFFQSRAQAEKYASDIAKIPAEHPGLLAIKKSDCFSCHAAKNKLIGPSFELIAKRYPNTADNINKLSKKIINGSIDAWGTAPMPAHPTILPDNAKKIVSWILANNTNPDITYLPGITGSFRTKEKPDNQSDKSVYVLIATYTDHGNKDGTGIKNKIQQTLILNNAE